jgi:hypothetical protein
MVAVSREFREADPDPARPPRPFGDLAQTLAVKGNSLATLGLGQLLIRGAKRTSSSHLIPGRADASVQPQAFNWESLRRPVLVEEFADLDARLSALPPASLRPRRVAEDFHVCTVAGVEGVQFVDATQTVEAWVTDARGQRARLIHPFTTRGQVGAESLLAVLREKAAQVRFVSGPVQRSGGALILHPVCVVWQEEGKRLALQPWVEARPVSAMSNHLHPANTVPQADPVGDYLRQLQAALGELLVLGLQRVDPQVLRRWRDLQRQGEAVGFGRLAGKVAALAAALEQKPHDLHWDWRAAGRGLLQLAALLRLAQDLAA